MLAWGIDYVTVAGAALRERLSVEVSQSSANSTGVARARLCVTKRALPEKKGPPRSVRKNNAMHADFKVSRDTRMRQARKALRKGLCIDNVTQGLRGAIRKGFSAQRPVRFLMHAFAII